MNCPAMVHVDACFAWEHRFKPLEYAPSRHDKISRAAALHRTWTWMDRGSNGQQIGIIVVTWSKKMSNVQNILKRRVNRLMRRIKCCAHSNVELWLHFCNFITLVAWSPDHIEPFICPMSRPRDFFVSNESTTCSSQHRLDH